MIESVRGGRTRQGLLALLLAGALLLCHGVYGASHQLHQTPGPASLHAAAHPSHDSHGGGRSPGGSHPDGGGGGHPDTSAYAAALAAVLLGAVVVAHLRGLRTWARAQENPVAVARPSLSVPALPRGSPPSVSQVFRL